MKSAVKITLAGLFLSLLAGCGWSGKWALHHIEPESARGDFALASVTLNDDQTYEATSQYEGKTRVSHGKWEHDNGKLTFIGEDGRTRTYDAQLTNMGSRMKVQSNMHGAPIVAVMRRE